MKTPRLLTAWLGALPLVFAPLTGFAQTVLEDFEGFPSGSQSANFAGSFTIIDGGEIFGTGNAARIDAGPMQHRFAWTGEANPLMTVSFDFYNENEVSEDQGFRFAFNLNASNMMAGTNNIVRFAMRPNGTFAIERAQNTVLTDEEMPFETPMTIHLVFNGSNNAVPNYFEDFSIGARSIDVWREIEGEMTHIGQAEFGDGTEDAALRFIGFTTPTAYASDGFIVDNLRWAEGLRGFIPEEQNIEAEISANVRGVPTGGTVRLDFGMSGTPEGSTFEITADQPVEFINGARGGAPVESGTTDVIVNAPDHTRVNFTLTLFDANGNGITTRTASVMSFDFDRPSPFPHPSILNTQVQLEAMRTTVLSRPDSVAGREWTKLRARADASLDYQHRPQTTVFVTAAGSNPSEDAFRQDAHAARSHALQWVVTGNTAHRDKAMEILSDWGNAFEDVQIEGGGIADQIYLESAWALPLWAAAADIIRYYNGGEANWDKADMAQFAAYLHTLYEESYKIRLRPSTRDYSSIGTGYHNWAVSANWAMMAYGAWSGHLEKFEEGLDNLFFILDDFSLPTGEINETCRDAWHPQYSIVSITDAAELAYTLGYDDLYMAAFDGQATPRLAVILEFFANLMLGRMPDPCSPSQNYRNQQIRAANYEVPYNHYINRMGAEYLPTFQEMVETAWRDIARQTEQFLYWSMLTHGLESSGVQFWYDTFALDGVAETYDWMHSLFVENAPWVYSFTLQNWILMPDELMSEEGAWMYIMR